MKRARKSKSNQYNDSWKRDDYKESRQEKKQRTETKKNAAQKIKIDYFTRSHRAKSNIAIVPITITILSAPIISSLAVR